MIAINGKECERLWKLAETTREVTIALKHIKGAKETLEH